MTRPPDAPPASADWAQQPERSNLAILRLFVERGVEIPYPQRVVRQA